jgi:competence protein ComEA
MKTMLKATMWKTVVVVAVMGFSTAAFAKGHARPKVEGVVNLNTASAEQLDALPGVAPKVAQAVVDYRKAHPFTKTEEVVRVKGIGKKRFQKIKAFLTVSGPTTLHAIAKLKKQAKTPKPT